MTEQLFDGALGELGVGAGGQPSLIVGDFNVEPRLKQSRLGSGLTWKLAGRQLVESSLLSLVSVLVIPLAFSPSVLIKCGICSYHH